MKHLDTLKGFNSTTIEDQSIVSVDLLSSEDLKNCFDMNLTSSAITDLVQQDGPSADRYSKMFTKVNILGTIPVYDINEEMLLKTFQEMLNKLDNYIR